MAKRPEQAGREREEPGRKWLELSRVFFSTGGAATAPEPEKPPALPASPDRNLQHALSRSSRGHEAGASLIADLLSGAARLRINKRTLTHSGEEAWVLLDEQRLIRSFSAAAGQRLDLQRESRGQAFNYYFQPETTRPVSIRTEDGSAGIGELTALPTRRRGRVGYLVIIRDVTRRERNRAALGFQQG